MKFITNWSRTSVALHSTTLSERYKNQCEQMWTYLDVFVCGKINVFNTLTSLIFS